MHGFLKLVRAACANTWANKERMLDNDRNVVYGNQNGLRMVVAQMLFEIGLLVCALLIMQHPTIH